MNFPGFVHASFGFLEIHTHLGDHHNRQFFFATDYKIKMDEIHEEKEWITYSHSSMFATFLQHIFVLLRHVSARSPIRLLQRCDMMLCMLHHKKCAEMH